MGNPEENKPAPAASPPATKTTFQIQLGKDWQDFAEEDSKALVSAFESGVPKTTLTMRGQSYEFDFTEMTQRNVNSSNKRKIRPPFKSGAAGYSAAAAPAAPFPDGQTEEDRGMMGGLAGAGAAAAALGAANHFGAFAGKVDPNNPNAGKHGFVQDHKWAAGALAVGGVIAAGLAGSAAQDSMSGGKHGKDGKNSGGGMLGGLFGGKKKKTGKKKDKSKKSGGGKKDKKVKSRDFDPNAEDSGDSSSSCETGPEDEGYDPKMHSDGRPRTPP